MTVRHWHMMRARLRSLFLREGRESDLREELQFHLDREIERLEASGMAGDAARLQALRTFGGVEHIKDACRDARGTGFIDDTVRDIAYAIRTFRRAPLVAFTIVCTIGLGLGLVAAVFTMVNGMLFRVDAVPNVRQMFAVERRTPDGEPQRFTLAQFDALRRETNVFTDAYAERWRVDSRVDGRVMWGTFVTGNFFQVLGVSAAMGRALTLADDQRFHGEPVLVLSHRGWERLYARDPAVLGRRLVINGHIFEIVGVMPEKFRGLRLEPDDYWAPLSMLPRVRPTGQGREASAHLDIVGRLNAGMSRQAAVAQLAAWGAAQSDGTPVDRSVLPVTLVPRRGTVQLHPEMLLVIAPLFFAFGLILLIGCANVANLLLARAVVRQREIGIRLSLGASRRRIVRQLLTESLLLALAAAVAAFGVSRVALNAIINAIVSSMPPDIGDIRLLVPDADWRVLLFLVVGAGVSTVAFALAPALQATRIDPIKTIRGEVAGDARPGRARNLLIALQVSASVLLLISAAVFLRSALASAAFDPGMRTSDTVVIQVANEASRHAIVQAVTAEPSVAAVAACSLGSKRASAESSGGRATVAYRLVSPECFSVLEIAVVRGRPFTPAERAADLSVAIVSQSAARTLWPNADPIGQSVRVDRARTSGPRGGDELPLQSQTFAVVGVARHVAGFRVAPFEKDVVYIPTRTATPGTSLIARVHGDPELARQALLDRLTTIDPEMGRQVFTMRTLARADTLILQIAFWVTVMLGGLALTLTLSGLFSVLTYLVEQRTREIGVRMSLGATTRDVTRLVLWQSMRPVGVGVLVGGGSAGAIVALLLATPLAGGVGEIIRVLDPLPYAASLFVVIAACLAAASIPAARAARLDPMLTLRQD